MRLQIIVLLCLTLSLYVYAGLQIVTTNPCSTAMIAGLDGPGIQITGCTFKCHALSTGTFTEDTGLFGADFTKGIILTTGRATDALGPNNQGGLSFTTAVTGDPDLQAMSDLGVYDVCSVTLQFKTSGTITWKYVFGSEEYEEYVGSQYNDVFGFFFWGPGFTKKNLALVPGTGAQVKINSINQNQNTAYYQSNTGNQIPSVQYDGFTKNLFVEIKGLNANEIYSVTLAIGDVGDSAWDSGVWLSAFSTADPFIGIEGDIYEITVECDAIPVSKTVTTGFCIKNPTITSTEQIIPGPCPKQYKIIRTFTASDTCGNTKTTTHTINVRDTTKPVLNGVPASVTVECGAVPNPPVVTATDNCDPPPFVLFSETKSAGYSCSNTYVLTRTWTASDSCGNTVTATQTITVKDTTKPVLSGVPADTTADCDGVPYPPTVTATDNCDSKAPLVAYSESKINVVNLNTYTLVRTWTSVDECGNTASASQKIQVRDLISPTLIGVPSDDSYADCDNVPYPPTVTASDNCDIYSPSVSLTEKYTYGNCENSYTITRTWTATDSAGNTATAVRSIQVRDTKKPTLHGVPGDSTYECDSIPAPAIVTATDNCDTGTIEVHFSEAKTGGDGTNTYTLVRTWTASDECGNSASASQTITVIDTTAPTLSGVPSETTVECNSVPVPATVTATDNCGTAILQVTSTDTIEAGSCENYYTITRTWTSTDAAGNTGSAYQKIHVQDTKPPVLNGVPADVTVECDNVPYPPTVTATDNCDEYPSVKYEETKTNGDCKNSYVLIRTWTATDECGNEATGTQTVTVKDTTPPVLNGIPSEITVNCDNIPEQATVTASDNCDSSPEVVFSEDTTDGPCANTYTIVRTWTTTDECGNEVSGSQTIHVIDTTPPVLEGVPGYVSVSCDSVPEPPEVTASDNCDTNTLDVDYTEERTDGNCENCYTLTRTWTTTDDCGNHATAKQIIDVWDAEAPVLNGVPYNSVAECDNVPEPAEVTATDNCDSDPEVTYSETRTDGYCVNYYSLTRTWTATDECGNEASSSQTVTVKDTTPPVLEGVPDDITVECDEIPEAPEVTASDNCDSNPTVSYSETRTDGDCPNTYTLTRTWTATDSCGNTFSSSQIVNVEDTTPPVLSGVPSDVTVECDEIPKKPTVTATDNCDTSTIEVIYSEKRTDGQCPNTYILTRTWTATDDCDNTVSASQVIHVRDTKAPVLSGVPSDINVQCASDVPAEPVVTATDNCDSNVQVTLTPVLTAGTCENRFTLRRTWTATDSCGNSDSKSQLITVFDNTPPTITNILDNVCIWPPNHNFWCATPAEIWSTSDNCKGTVKNVLKYCNSSQCDEAPCPSLPGQNGDGSFPDDCKIVTDKLCFRSERIGVDAEIKKPIRSYFAFETFSDVCDNKAEKGVTVQIPHDVLPKCVCPNYNPKGRN